jgi:mono/diheme cytochrome c family protein
MALSVPARLGASLCLALWSALPARADDFRDAVAPILEAKCVRCHGGTSTKGDLSLATLEAAREGGQSGPAIEPGKPDESLLIDMISGEKPAMPKGSAPLTPEEVATLRRWIEQVASWPEGVALQERRADDGPWWAIQPLARPGLPAVADPSWVRTPIDAFLLAKLESKGLSPRPEADRRTLIRRLTFDLHGLPPTPEEVEAFMADTRPDAYERLVDRLLDSPRYGERWGRHWLDVVHYGDTHGYDKDKRRDHAWPYRDYVIRALNDDRPYSRFVREQLAGDVLAPGDPEGIVATGFVAAGPWDFVGHVELREGTVEKEKTRLVDRDDMLANAMSTFVSLTVHCARCHDHKFDPIPQRDYYRLQAVFAGVDRGDRPYPDAVAAEKRKALEQSRDESLARLKRLEAEAQAAVGPETARLDAVIASLREQISKLPPPAVQAGSPTNGYHSGIHPKPDATAWVQVDLGRSLPIDEIRLVPARPTDFPDSPGFGFPRVYRVEASDEPGFADPTTIVSESRPDDEPQPDEPVVLRAGGREARYVRVTASRLWERTNDYVFALGELEVLSGGRNVAAGGVVTALDTIEAGRWSKAALVDGFTSREARPAAGDAAANRRYELLSRIGQAARERRNLADDRLAPALRSALEEARREVADREAALQAQPATELVYAPVPHAPRAIHVLNRGEVEQPRDLVGPGALSCVPGPDPDFAAADDEGARRLALAEWVTDPRNPLTWRSIVNRVWHYHFGRGLVATPNDFGRNGSTPTHPELLDWLAAEFRDGGQSLKGLHRLIVTSAAYRQSSAGDPEAARVDGGNTLLWRMNRRRLEAEEVRDSVLAVSGRLDPKMGGPGFEVFRFKDDHSPTYDHLDPAAILRPEGRRRCVYRFAVRSVPNPYLECLDGADPNTNLPVRNETITALQALTLLNDPFMIAESEAFAARLRSLSDDPRRQVESAFSLAFGRPPRSEERDAVSAFVARHGLPNACRLLFNMNEFVFVD